MGVLLGINVPLVNVLSVSALARSAANGTEVGRGVGVLGALACNPLILSTVAGLAGNVAGLTLPSPVDATLSRIAAAAVPLGLLAVGAALRVGGMRSGQGLVGAEPGAGKMLALAAAAPGV